MFGFQSPPKFHVNASLTVQVASFWKLNRPYLVRQQSRENWKRKTPSEDVPSKNQSVSYTPQKIGVIRRLWYPNSHPQSYWMWYIYNPVIWYNPLISPINSVEPIHWTNQSQVEPFHGSTHCDELGAELPGDQMVKAIRYENYYTIWYYDISHKILL